MSPSTAPRHTFIKACHRLRTTTRSVLLILVCSTAYVILPRTPSLNESGHTRSFDLHAQSTAPVSTQKSRLAAYENNYNQYLQQKKDLRIIKLTIDQVNGIQGGRYLQELITYLQRKNDRTLNGVILQKMAQLGDYNLIYKLFFNDPKKHAGYRRIHKNFYYRTLLTIGERRELLKTISLALAYQTGSISQELAYLKLLTQKEKQPNFFQNTIRQLNLTRSTSTSLSPDAVKFIKRSLMEHILYYTKDYHALVDLLQKPDLDGIAQKSFTALKHSKTKIKQGLLEKLHYLGYYDAYLQLAEILATEVNVSSSRIAEAAYLAKKANHQDKYKTYSPKLTLKTLFLANEYKKVIAFVSEQKTSHPELSSHPYYMLSVAAEGAWDLFNTDFIKLPTTNQVAFLWIEPLFKSQHHEETLFILQEKEHLQLSLYELSYLNIRNELTSTEDLNMLHEVLRRILIKDTKLVAYMEENIKKLPSLIFDYGMSEAARHYMERGLVQEGGDLFRKYYQVLQENAFREKFFYFYAVTTYYDNPEEGKKLVARFLSSYPKSSYRQEIKALLATIVL